MQITIKAKNYRCFPSTSPLELTLANEFCALIGVNNAGKSSVLKLFYELRGIFNLFKDNNVLQQAIGGSAIGFQPPPSVTDIEGIFSNNDSGDIEIELAIVDLASLNQSTVTKAIITIFRRAHGWTAKFVTHGFEIAPGTLQSGSVSWQGNILKTSGGVVIDFQYLREALEDLSNTYYVPSFRHITAFTPVDGAPSSYYDINIGRPFIDMWHGMQTGNNRLDRLRIHNLVEDIRQIFDFKALQINASLGKQTLQLIIDGKPFDLADLGSGLAQFILVLASAAFRKPSYIMIDEPELNLHPSLQVKFLMSLGSHASKGVLFATHNLGLARSVADKTYSITAEAIGSRVALLQDTSRLAELLGELSYEGYRPLGFDKLLLVEGRTSFKVFVEFLRILNRDHEFLVVPMSDLINQNSREELQEVTRICPRVFAVIDSERQVAGQAISAGRLAFEQNCRDLGIGCHISDYRAIENYFPDRVVKIEMGSSYTALTPFQDRQGIRLWSKKDNWKIARRMERAELEACDIGQFLLRI